MPGMADAPALYRFLRKALPPILNPYLSMHMEGQENLPVDGPYIMAMNHLSFIDSIVVPVNIPRPVYFLGKADYWDSWRTRWFFEGTGVVPVQRGGSGSGDEALRTGVEILERGDLLGIYPEGTRSPDGRLYRGKTGPVRIALRTGAPILPVAMMGTFDVLPPTANVPKLGRVGVRVEPLEGEVGDGRVDLIPPDVPAGRGVAAEHLQPYQMGATRRVLPSSSRGSVRSRLRDHGDGREGTTGRSW